jgi:hypothetical protein
MPPVLPLRGRARQPPRAELGRAGIGLFGIAAGSFAEGCCCCFDFPKDIASEPGSLVAVVAYALLPLAVALAFYQRQTLKEAPRWAARTAAKAPLLGAAYRTRDVVLESIAIPSAVRWAGFLGLAQAAASLTAGIESAHWLRASWSAAFVGEPRGSLVSVAMAAVILASILASGLLAVFYGNAILRCKVGPERARRAGGLLVLVSVALVGLAVVEWGALLRDLAGLLNQASDGPPAFGPTTLTTVAGLAVVGAPLLGLGSGVAFLLAAPELG